MAPQQVVGWIACALCMWTWSPSCSRQARARAAGSRGEGEAWQGGAAWKVGATSHGIAVSKKASGVGLQQHSHVILHQLR